MTREEMQDLAGRRRFFARILFRCAVGYVALTASLLGLVLVLSQGDMAAAPLLDSIGTFLMGVGALLLTGASLADASRPDRYVGGDLVVRCDRWRLGQYLAGLAVLELAGVVIAFGLVRVWGGGGWLVGAVLVLGLAGGLAYAMPLLAQWFSPAPILTITREGLFAPYAMRQVVSWDELESVPVAPSTPQYLLALKTRTHDHHWMSFWTRPMGSRATHLIAARGADTSQTDVLLAVAHFRPDLIAALTLPKATGFKAAISPARTI